MRRPRGGGDQVAIYYRGGHLDRRVDAPGQLHFRRAGGIGADFSALENSGGGEQLSGVANGRDGLLLFREMPDDAQDFFVKAQVFWRAASGEDQTVVVLGANFGEGGVQ